MAQSFIADATMSATDGSSSVPSSMVRITDWYTALGSRCFMTARLNTFEAKKSPTLTLEKFSGSEIGEYLVTASMAWRRSGVPLTLVCSLSFVGRMPWVADANTMPLTTGGKNLKYREPRPSSPRHVPQKRAGGPTGRPMWRRAGHSPARAMWGSARTGAPREAYDRMCLDRFSRRAVSPTRDVEIDPLCREGVCQRSSEPVPESRTEQSCLLRRRAPGGTLREA